MHWVVCGLMGMGTIGLLVLVVGGLVGSWIRRQDNPLKF